MAALVRELDSQWGRTPCHLAAWKGHEDSVRLLIDRGANIEATDNVRAQRDPARPPARVAGPCSVRHCGRQRRSSPAHVGSAGASMWRRRSDG